ncbi:DUF4124 domain-containing protein [Acinetobacter sp. R933-2]|uniref:DUF4124 domain-containing protein n=1 Tax=Acinetobacter sp. R933-2 TaxID=2746728 RepID=UPI002575A1CC|nr:DUF4124 domain-containing protein [Acinetobacter sp. R933-2]MDM1248532.1 DUF4124 domain-containing protein [Acinetobacter sp. R933-2]
MKPKLLSILFLGAFLFSPITNGEIYKWVDAKGNVTYSSKPPPNGIKRQPIETIRSLNTTQTQSTNKPYEFKSNSSIPTTYRDPRDAYHRPVNRPNPPPQQTPEQEALRQKIIQEASTPYKGSQNGQLTANQLRTLAAMDGVNVSSGDSDSSSNGSYSAPMPQAQAPTHMTSCDGSGCWDNQGNRYNGNNGTYYNNGRVCRDIGGQMQCN